MKSLGEILNGLAEQGRGQLQDTGDLPDPPELQIECATCNDQRYVRRAVPPNHPDFGKAFRCPDCGQNREAEAMLRRRARMPDDQRDCTFASLDTKRENLTREQRNEYLAIVRQCRTYAEGKAQEPWLVMLGQPGWGKTHLAVCICNQRFDHPELGLPTALYATAPELIQQLKDSIGTGDFSTAASDYQSAPFLVIDDLGAENETPFVDEQLFRILDSRATRRLPTIVTLNVTPDRLQPRIADRLMATNTGLSNVLWPNLPSYRSGREWGKSAYA